MTLRTKILESVFHPVREKRIDHLQLNEFVDGVYTPLFFLTMSSSNRGIHVRLKSATEEALESSLKEYDFSGFVVEDLDKTLEYNHDNYSRK